jgi:hypothetical protein
MSDEQYNNTKEAMTILLNVIFKDLLGDLTDKGYPQHKEMRVWMRDEYSNNPDLDALIEKAKQCESASRKRNSENASAISGMA